MVARGAGAAGPVLLACRQWDPCGLAWRLPSLGAGALRGAPLLPWRVQCPGRVCAALAAGSGGLGLCLVSCLLRFTLPAPCFLRCVWRAVPSGCPLSLLAGTPFHAVCAFRGLGPVALLVFAACPLCVCALALPRRLRLPPPPLVGVARAPRAVPVLGAGRAVPRGPCSSACPAPVPCPVWFAWGGGGRSGPVSPLPGLGLCAPRGVGLRVWGVLAPGAGVGGGAACAPFCPTVRPEGPVGRGVALPRSVPLASPGRQQSGCPWRRSGHGGRGPHTAPVRAPLLSPGAVHVAPLRVGVGSLVQCGSCGSRRLGRGGGPCSGLPPGRRGPAGGRGDHPLCLGGAGGPAPPWLAGRWGGWGDRGGEPAVASHPPLLGGAACGPLPSPPFVAGASPTGVRVGSGSGCSPGRRVLPAAGGPAWRGEGRPVSRPPRGGAGGPGGRFSSINSSALPGRATMWASLGTLRSWGARPPYCSSLLSRAAPGRGPCVVLVRWCGLARLSQPPREQAVGGAGARGVRVQLRPPPGRRGPFWGRGDVPSASGGVEGRRPRGPQAGGGMWWRGEGGPRRCSPAPCPQGVARGPRTCPPSSPTHPPSVYTFSRGCQAALGAGRGLVGRRWVNVAWGGGEVSLPRCAPAPSPGGYQGGRLRLRIPGCRRSVAAHGAGTEPLVGTGQGRGGWAVDWGCLARGCARRGCDVPPLCAAALLGGCGAAVPPVGLRRPTGRGGGGGGEGGGGGLPAVPHWSPCAASRPPRVGSLVVPIPGGQPPTWGARPLCRPSLGPPALLAAAARCQLAGGGGGRAGECWGRCCGSAVSG